jgi:hypothetical protein
MQVDDSRYRPQQTTHKFHLLNEIVHVGEIAGRGADPDVKPSYSMKIPDPERLAESSAAFFHTSVRAQGSETKINPIVVDGEGECRISKEEFYGFAVELVVDSENRGVALEPDWHQALGSPLKTGCVSEIRRGQEMPIDLLAKFEGKRQG